MDKMIKRLNTIGMLYYILAGLGIIASFITPAIMIKTSTTSDPQTRMILMIGACASLVGSFLLVACIALVGHALRKHRWWTFCFVVSILLCPSFPFGTAIGVATLITLSKPETKKLFAPNQQNQPIAGKPVSG